MNSQKTLDKISSFNEEGYKYVAYDGFIPHLIEAVKELSSENDDLKSRITALENA